MSDAKIRELERRVAAGDADAQRQLDAERIRICKHKGQTFTAGTCNLWGPKFETWCTECGYCISDPTQDPKPETARAEREFSNLVNNAIDFESMSPEEQVEWQRRFSENLQIEGFGAPIDLD